MVSVRRVWCIYKPPTTPTAPVLTATQTSVNEFLLEQQRRRGKTRPVPLRDLVAAGKLDADEQLIAERNGQRWHARFAAETGAVEVADGSRFLSLTAAALHCSGAQTANGWDFWGVVRLAEFAP